MPKLTLKTSNFKISFEQGHDDSYFKVEVGDLSKTKLKIVEMGLKAKYGKDVEFDYYEKPFLHRPWVNFYIIPYDEKKNVSETGTHILKTMEKIFSSLKFDGFKFKPTNKKKAILKLVMNTLWSNANSKGKLIGKERVENELMNTLKLKPTMNRMRLLASKMRTYSKIKRSDSIDMAKLLLS